MTIFRDLRYAIRSLSRAWGFSALVVVTLGLGIGANTAVFSALRGVVLRPLPHRSGGELVYLRQSAELTGEDNVRFSVPEVIDYRDEATLLTGFAEFSAMTFNMVGHTEPVQVTTGIVTGNYFEVLGLGAVAGRTFDDREDGPAAEPAMVLTHEYWMRMFGGAPDVIGRNVRVNGRALTIVGVLQPAPHYPQRTDVFVNMVTSPHHLSATMVQGRTHRMTEVFARLTPGARVAQANAELVRITTRVHGDYPDAYETAAGYQVVATPLREVLTGEARLTLQLLMATTLLVLLIALANVANLMLMRLVGREQELAVRWSLGASAWRLRRLLLMESGVLAMAGAGLGLALAWPTVGLLVRMAERLTPRAAEIRVDGAVLGFTVVVALAVACALAFAPSFGRLRTLGASPALKDARATPGGSRRRAQRGLVVVQVAVTAVVLTTAGLLARTLFQLQAVDPGLEPEGVLTMEVPIGGAGRAPGDVLTLYEEMHRRMAGLPGVVGVALGSNVPLRSSDFMLEVAVDGRALRPGEPTPRAEYRTASPEYFEVAGIPLLRGRAFASTDRGQAERVAILTQGLADRLFPDRDPIGRQVAWTGDVLRFLPVSGDWRTVVGVVGDTRDGGPDVEPRPVLYQPFAQEVFTGAVLIRTRSAPGAVAPAAAGIIRALVPDQPIVNVMTLDDVRRQPVASRRLNAVLLVGFAALALLIAGVGVAGMLAFSVARRTGEIGIRMSLGADTSRVLRLVLGEGGALVAWGLATGIAGSLLAGRLLAGLLFGVPPHDPLTLVGVVALMSTVGIVACAVPALRAARVNPATAMREG
jgi:predicted permease